MHVLYRLGWKTVVQVVASGPIVGGQFKFLPGHRRLVMSFVKGIK